MAALLDEFASNPGRHGGGGGGTVEMLLGVLGEITKLEMNKYFNF